MFTSWGFSKARSSVCSVVVTGIWNNFGKVAAPIVGLALLALQGQPGGGRMAAALAGVAGLIGAIVLFALVLHSDAFAAKTGTVASAGGHRRCSAWSGGVR